MRYDPINPELFIHNRLRLTQLLSPHSLAIVNANDILPTNADGSLPVIPQSDLFYLTGVEQEQTILLLAPNAFDDKIREVLFVRETSDLLKIWEGYKLTKEHATQISGIKSIKLLSEFPAIFHRLMCEVEHVYLNSNEHARADIVVQSRDARFIAETQSRYPLHDYRRLAPLMHTLRAVKSPIEVELLKRAITITDNAFRRVAKFTKPGVREYEIEAEFAHEYIRHGAEFAYAPIIGSGANACVLHYLQNDQVCKDGDMLLLDVAARYTNYNADLTRTLPVNGRFTPRQKDVYNAVLRVLRASIKNATVGKLHRDWQKEAQALMNDELLKLGLITPDDIQKQTDETPACKKFFPHGLGHPLGLAVHDYTHTHQPMAPGWVLTVEPGIYIPQENLGIRLENNILLTANGPIDLMPNIPLETQDIEALMHS